MIKKLNINIDSVKPPKWLDYKITWKDKVNWFIRDHIINLIPYSIREFYYNKVKTIWKPQHSRIRKAVPRYWWDLDGVLLNVNFEIIKSFYEDEYLKDLVDWEGTSPEAAKFAKWLEGAYKYVAEERPALEKLMENAYPEPKAEGTYEQLYKKVNYYEKIIDDTDTKILKELIEYRHHLWT